MFFQTINRMITAGTDLSINIRQVNDKLTVAVMPRREALKDTRTEGAGHPYQPGNIRETSGTGRITKQGGQVRS